MGKMPYIPVYIGDWAQDTDDITLEAEGALIRLVFKLWKSKEKGRLLFSFSRLSILFKKSDTETRKILYEIQEKEVLNVTFLADDMVKIESRRMLNAASKSAIYSDNGKKGGRPSTKNKSKSKAKAKPITENESDNDIDNDIEIVNEKEGQGEKTMTVPERLISYLNELGDFKKSISNPGYHKHINGRLAEKYTEEELREIIEVKVAQWKGDIKMEKYLTPDTLFNKEKAAKYRDEVADIKRKGMTLDQVKGVKTKKDAKTLTSEAMALSKQQTA